MTTKTTLIAFTTDKNNNPLAYRDSRTAMRWIKISYNEAKMMVATGQATEVKYTK